MTAAPAPEAPDGDPLNSADPSEFAVEEGHIDSAVATDAHTPANPLLRFPEAVTAVIAVSVVAGAVTWIVFTIRDFMGNSAITAILESFFLAMALMFAVAVMAFLALWFLRLLVVVVVGVWPLVLLGYVLFWWAASFIRKLQGKQAEPLSEALPPPLPWATIKDVLTLHELDNAESRVVVRRRFFFIWWH